VHPLILGILGIYIPGSGQRRPLSSSARDSHGPRKSVERPRDPPEPNQEWNGGRVATATFKGKGPLCGNRRRGTWCARRFGCAPSVPWRRSCTKSALGTPGRRRGSSLGVRGAHPQERRPHTPVCPHNAQSRGTLSGDAYPLDLSFDWSPRDLYTSRPLRERSRVCSDIEKDRSRRETDLSAEQAET